MNNERVHSAKKAIQRLLNYFGYSLHKIGTLEERQKTLLQEIESRDAKISNLEAATRLYVPRTDDCYEVREEFQRAAQFSNAALQKLIDDYKFDTVLDIGAGGMEHSEVFAKFGKQVTAVDFGVSVYHQKRQSSSENKINLIIGDFAAIEFDQQFDCVWASHVLEHQPNASIFLEKVTSLVKEDGIIAITVPHFKHEIVGGHVSLWNAGLVMYRLVLAGIDCSDAAVLSYGYNVSVIAKKRAIVSLEGIEFDRGDIRRLLKYLPANLHFNSNEFDDPFDGNIARLNW